MKPVKNLGGHDIKQYEIHGDKFIRIVKDKTAEAEGVRLEENEVIAIETFGSTGSGYAYNQSSKKI